MNAVTTTTSSTVCGSVNEMPTSVAVRQARAASAPSRGCWAKVAAEKTVTATRGSVLGVGSGMPPATARRKTRAATASATATGSVRRRRRGSTLASASGTATAFARRRGRVRDGVEQHPDREAREEQAVGARRAGEQAPHAGTPWSGSRPRSTQPSSAAAGRTSPP